MSKWIWLGGENPKKPEEWVTVLGLTSRGPALCQRFMHSSGNEHWTVNGTSGPPKFVEPPSYWMPIPEHPYPWRKNRTAASPGVKP